MSYDKPIYSTFKEERFVGRITKEPFFGNGFAAFDVAVNLRYKGVDGKYKDAETEFKNVIVFDDDNYRFVQDNLRVGVAVEVYGRVNIRERTDNNGVLRVNSSIVVSDKDASHYLKLATPLERKGNTASSPANVAPKAATKARSTELDDEVPF